VWLVPVFMYVSVVPIHGAFRYRTPLDPFLLMLAAYAIASAMDALRGQPSGRRNHAVTEARVTTLTRVVSWCR
jgi:hypothetical protein